jgi:putative phosphoribosyl transferase
VVVVRKLGVPFQPELGMGAVGEDGVTVVNEGVVRSAGIDEDELDTVRRREQAEVAERARRFRAHRPRIPLLGRTAILVDDGIATGSTMRAACQIVRASGAERVIVAVPVAPSDALNRLRQDADEVICLHTPRWFSGVGEWYRDFSQTADSEVTELLDRAAAAQSSDPPSRDEGLTLQTRAARLAGNLTVPHSASGLVLFAHGSGSSRHSPRNRYVAKVLNEAGLATLLFDLLTPTEELDRANVFAVDRLAERLVDVTQNVVTNPAVRGLPVGYFGASTGAAAALVAAAELPDDIRAVVSRGGRPDLAADSLGLVRAPTLLIVGAWDTTVLELNRQAQRRLRCDNDVAVVPGATHLFEEPGTLQVAAELARDWFLSHLSGAQRSDAER